MPFDVALCKSRRGDQPTRLHMRNAAELVQLEK